MVNKVTVLAPATVANIGIGFDIVGMAVDGLGDVITVTRDESHHDVIIEKISGDDGKLPLESDKNTASIAARHVRDGLGKSDGINVEITKGLPLASGLGSSAASAAGAAVATNLLFGNPLETSELLPACLEAEGAVSGYHADNVAPCLLGGVLLITGTEPQDLHPLPIPHNAHFALVTPNVAVPTAEARAVLPKQTDLEVMISQTQGVALLMQALYKFDLNLLATAMMSDLVIEPARKQLIPHFDEAKKLAMENGALAMVISGAGPTLCILADSKEKATLSGEQVKDLYVQHGIGARLYVTKTATEGVRVLDKS